MIVSDRDPHLYIEVSILRKPVRIVSRDQNYSRWESLRGGWNSECCCENLFIISWMSGCCFLVGAGSRYHILSHFVLCEGWIVLELYDKGADTCKMCCWYPHRKRDQTNVGARDSEAVFIGGARRSGYRCAVQWRRVWFTWELITSHSPRRPFLRGWMTSYRNSIDLLLFFFPFQEG